MNLEHMPHPILPSVRAVHTRTLSMNRRSHLVNTCALRSAFRRASSIPVCSIWNMHVSTVPPAPDGESEMNSTPQCWEYIQIHREQSSCRGISQSRHIPNIQRIATIKEKGRDMRLGRLRQSKGDPQSRARSDGQSGIVSVLTLPCAMLYFNFLPAFRAPVMGYLPSSRVYRSIRECQ